MMRTRHGLITHCFYGCIGIFAAWGSGPALGADWDYFGANTLRLERYNTVGNAAFTPYRTEGPRAYNDFSLNLMRRESEFDLWRVQIYGVANGSEYRSPFDGPVLERFSLFREKGDAGLPYRFEVGDYFANFSYRTLQRSLKGGMLELQPATTSSADWRYSIVMLTGAGASSWRSFTADEDYTNGLSLLMVTPGNTRIVGNVLQNRRDGNFAQGTLVRSQQVASLGFEHDTRFSAQRLKFEGEVGAFYGDHDGVTTALSGQRQSGNAYYGQVSGRATNMPLDYRFRAERYDQDYRPTGAVVSPDRRSFEAHAGWLYPDNLSLRARAQAFTDGLQTGNPTDTRTYGATLSGLLFPQTFRGLTGSVDTFLQDQEKRDRTIDRRTFNLNANVSLPLSRDWFGRVGLFSQRLRDHVTGAADVSTTQLSFGADHSFQVGGFVGTLTPGVALRFVRGGTGATDDVNPTLAFNLSNGPHRVGFNYGLLAQAPTVFGNTNVATQQLAADYRYTRGQNTFGAELNVFDRAQDGGVQSTTAYRVSLFWTHNFEKMRTAAAGAALISDAVGTGAALPRSPGLLLALAPGSSIDTQLKRLEESGFRGVVSQPGVAVIEARLLDEIEQRQRVAVTHEAGNVVKSALIVDLGAVGGVDTLAQVFERVRRALLDRYGRPLTTFDEGSFTPTLAADLAAGRFIRVMEWATEHGRLRLGIPRRLDGTVRIEVQHARSFPQPRDTAWSIETVR